MGTDPDPSDGFLDIAMASASIRQPNVRRSTAESDAGDENESIASEQNPAPGAPYALSRNPHSLNSEWRLATERFAECRKSEEQLDGLRRRGARHFNNAAKDEILGYYRRQNNILDQFSEIDELLATALNRPIHNNDPDQALVKRSRSEQLAMRLSFGANIVLFVAKVLCALSSGSLSIITSALDSFLDLVSGVILYITVKAQSTENKYRFPAGKSRMQPLGIIVFSCIMGTLGFQVLIEATRQLIGKEHTHHLESLWFLVGVMVSVVVVKAFLYLWCRNNPSEAVKVYADDHFNDVLTNSVGLAGALAGDRIIYWIDPLGAMLLAAYIVWNWGNTALENTKALVGLSASPEFLQKVTFLCYNHHQDVMKIDTVRAYTFGPRFFCEVDVVLPADLPLRQAHDIGESLQDKIEAMPEIERAFVHLDYECDHPPEHTPRNYPWQDSIDIGAVDSVPPEPPSPSAISHLDPVRGLQRL